MNTKNWEANVESQENSSVNANDLTNILNEIERLSALCCIVFYQCDEGAAGRTDERMPE